MNEILLCLRAEYCNYFCAVTNQIELYSQNAITMFKSFQDIVRIIVVNFC